MCGKEFSKPKNEYNRRIKLGKTKLFCSLKCSANRPENVENIKKFLTYSKLNYFKGGENKLLTDEEILLSGLKEFSRRIRRRKKFLEEISPIDLLSIWKAQNGKCAITAVNLILPNDISYTKVSNNYKASIDRIDSSKPYVLENIQFLSVTMNLLKADMKEKDVKDFITIIKNV